MPARFAPLVDALRTIDPLSLSRLVAIASDVALVIDPGGTITHVAFTDEQLDRNVNERWVGRALTETVTVESRHKAERMLAVVPGGAPLWQEVNHRLDDGELPVRYAAFRLDAGGPLIALGRDLRGLAHLQQQLVDTNLSIERDYASHRSAESQFRTLFQTSSEAMLVADASSRKITDANPAAEDLLHRVTRRLVGTRLDDLFATESMETVGECFAALRALGQASCPVARLRLNPVDVGLAAWLLRGGGTSQILLRLFPTHVSAASVRGGASAWDALRHLPEAIVTADGALAITDANEAFLDLVDVATAQQLRNEPLATFIGRHGVDVDVLMSRLEDNGSIRRYGTAVRGQFGAVHEIELTAALSDDGTKRAYAFLLRPTTSDRSPAIETRRPLRPVSEMTDLVGRVPLRDIVREATDIIEELCIEAALDVTQDNRASAAEMLGLSRQSLYSKLRRYGIGDLPSDPTDPA